MVVETKCYMASIVPMSGIIIIIFINMEKKFGMISGRIKGIVLKCMVILYMAGLVVCCKSHEYGWGPDLELSAKEMTVGLDGGHLEVETNGKACFVISYVLDNISHNEIRGVEKEYLFKFDDMTICHPSKSQKIMIDVAASDTLNDWQIGILSGDTFESVHVLQIMK